MVPDALFPTNNKFGIPTLDLDFRADYVDGTVKAWGSLARANRHKGTWHFYVDDYKFDTLWTHPEKVTNTKAVTVCEVNYSVNEQMPLAVILYKTFQKRWLARWWQSLGIRIFVDLNVPASLQEYNLLGVPEGWSAFSTRAFDHSIEVLQKQAELIKSYCEKPLFLVVGGGQKVNTLCLENNWVHITWKGDN